MLTVIYIVITPANESRFGIITNYYEESLHRKLYTTFTGHISKQLIIKKAGADMHFAFQLRLVEGAVIYFPTFAVSSTW